MKNLTFFLFTLVFLALAGLCFSPLVTVVQVSDPAGRALVEEPVRPGDLISVLSTHSVEKTGINETYAVEGDGRLSLAYGSFESGGAGLPSDISYDIEQGEDGKFIIRHYNRTFNELIYETGNISRHRVVVGGHEYDMMSRLNNDNKFIIRTTKDSPAHIFVLRFWG